MRTSRISRDTTSIVNATTSVAPKRRHNVSIKDENQSTDIEDSISAPLKRKRSSDARTPTKRSPGKTVTVKSEIEDRVAFSPAKERKVRKPARQVKNSETGEIEIHPPNDWAEVYAVVKEMRTTGKAQHAAVDTMGCERLAQDVASPKVKRYHTLTALMLSSQTKDTTNAAAMSRLYNELPPYQKGAPGGLNLENILAVDPKLLNELIWAVGFHNNKTKYIKATAEILRDTWGGDIPDTIEGLMSLPGVGPKMGYLCLSVAWGRTEGIGVDVHVHRITNLWGWNKTKGPEETRLALQQWLPQERWHEINWLLVGLGQTVCLPVGRKCGDCELGLRGLCRSAERGKVSVGRKVKEEEEGRLKADGDGEALEVKQSLKVEEEVSQDVPVTVIPKAEEEKEEEEEGKDSIPRDPIKDSPSTAQNGARKKPRR